MHGTFLALDFETATPDRTSACAMGVCAVNRYNEISRSQVKLIRPPQGHVHPMNYRIHGISWDDLQYEEPFPEVWAHFSGLFHEIDFLAAHNVPFDKAVLTACCEAAGIPVPDLPWVCTVELARKKWGVKAGNKLNEVCERLSIPFDKHHEAGADAEACARVLVALRGGPPPAVQLKLFEKSPDLVTVMRVPTDGWVVPDVKKVLPKITYRPEELFAYARYIGLTVLTRDGVTVRNNDKEFCNALHNAAAASVDGGPWRTVQHEVPA